jgi:hypothetical protein
MANIDNPAHCLRPVREFRLIGRAPDPSSGLRLALSKVAQRD